MKLLSFSLLFGIVLLGTMRMSEACSCLPSHPQTLFCNSDVVIRAKVINETIHNPDSADAEIQYGIKTTKMFKGWDKITEVHDVYTMAESSMCGVRLNAEGKTEYLLAGYLRGNKVTINLCGLYAQWQDVPSFQIKSLTDGAYKKGCACQIRICFVDPCDNHARNECFWNGWNNGGTWLADNSICVPGKGGSCSWQSSPGAKQPIYKGHP